MKKYTVIARTDKESASRPPGVGPREERIKDDIVSRAATTIRWRSQRVRRSIRVNPTTDVWERKAQKRLPRCVRLLSGGETVVTDRLHAMLIALQMGRRVVAVDSSTKKLRNYYESWLSDASAPVSFAPNFKVAILNANRG